VGAALDLSLWADVDPCWRIRIAEASCEMPGRVHDDRLTFAAENAEDDLAHAASSSLTHGRQQYVISLSMNRGRRVAQVPHLSHAPINTLKVSGSLSAVIGSG